MQKHVCNFLVPRLWQFVSIESTWTTQCEIHFGQEEEQQIEGTKTNWK